MACEPEGRYVEQALGADDVRKLQEVGGLDEEHSPKFEALLEYFINDDVEHSTQCPLCKTASGRAPGVKCIEGCERWRIHQGRDSAVAQWITKNGFALVAKTGQVDQEARRLGCSAFPEIIEKHETAASRWRNTLKKLCGKLDMVYIRVKRRGRNRPDKALRTGSSPRRSLAREPAKISCARACEAPLQGPVTKMQNGEDDSLPWKLIVDPNKHVRCIKKVGGGRRGKAVKVS